MTLKEAIEARHSVRQYIDKPVEEEKIAQIKALIEQCNQESGGNMQLVVNEPNAFGSGLAKYGKFSGVSNYIAVIGKKGTATLLGYQAERVVLLAQQLGLNTCWVGLTFKKQPDQYVIGDGEQLFCVISLGYGANGGKQHPMRPVQKFYEDARVKEKQSQLPEWFREGLNAAILAPTAVNQQKFLFTLHDDNKVAATAKFALMSSYSDIDLGIVKCHFEIGAGIENFSWKE